MINLDAATVLLQWATGGMLFYFVTRRHGLVGPGYGWLLRGIFGVLAVGALVAGRLLDPVPLRDASAAAVAVGAALGAWITPLLGLPGLVAAGVASADGTDIPLAVARIVIGAAFLGAVTDAMLLGHWYLVQPGMSRGPLHELNRWVMGIWPFEVGALLWPVGMLSVLAGTIDDGYGGILGWFWVACAVTTLVLGLVTRAALREREYSAVMAATGLLYLAILTAFGTDLVARALLA